ncbi:AmmeMemoRadiSam system protein B [candidate division KSB1 bacterium]|nr:AmmeMemoRadiSam system protein B [candidate division KSB1 bacterium]
MKSDAEEKIETKLPKADDVRHPAVAGQFYLAEKNALRDRVNAFMDRAGTSKIEGRIFGLISPHAGYDFSGQTAAYAYKSVVGKRFDAVILFAPSHYADFPFHGVAVWEKGAYETPLGSIPVHQQLAAELIRESGLIRASKFGHVVQTAEEVEYLASRGRFVRIGDPVEHSLEVQLPFLQVAIDDLKIVPIMVQRLSLDDCEKISDAIARVCKDKRVLLVASTDLYHGESYSACVETNARTLAQIEEFEPADLYNGFYEGKFQACGWCPVVVVQMAAQKSGATQTSVVHRTNSNDVIQRKGGYVVGYGAAVIYNEEQNMLSKKTLDVDMGLKSDEKKLLLKIARETIEHLVKGQKVPEYKIESPILKEKRGAFVTLNKHEQLRGCIGHIIGYHPLYETVQQMAEAAAFRDPRFPQVTADEVRDLHIEISVLTPIRQISDINEIEVGKHGIIIERKGASGLLLPQVATDYGWDRITFLEHTCRKAGLPNDSWKQEGTVIKIFSADVFGE